MSEYSSSKDRIVGASIQSEAESPAQRARSKVRFGNGHWGLACSVSFLTLQATGCAAVDVAGDEQPATTEASLSACLEGVPLCPDNMVSACEHGTWPNGVIYFRFKETKLDGTPVSEEAKAEIPYIKDAFEDWQSATAGAVRFVEAPTTMPESSILTIIPMDPRSGGDSGTGPGSTCRTSAWSAYHELGHAIGIVHPFSRYDRNHYYAINHTPWYDLPGHSCGMYPRCSDPDGDFGPSQYRTVTGYTVGDPDITRWDLSPLSGNACQVNTWMPASPVWYARKCPTDRCANVSPGTISLADAGKVVEMYNVRSGGWDKFRHTDNEVKTGAGARQPYPSTMGRNVTMIGSPAIAVSPGSTNFRIFARGSDNQLYEKAFQLVAGQRYWGSWKLHPNGTFASDPAAAYAGGYTHLAALGAGGVDVWMQSWASGTPGGYAPLGAPSAGTASAPAITSWGAGRLDVFVRGRDNRLYWRSCSTTGTDCSPNSGNWNDWTLVSTSATFIGKPAVVSGRVDGVIDVFVHGMDHQLWGVQYANGVWHGFYKLNLPGTLGWKEFPGLAGSCTNDDCYSPAVAASPTGLDIIIRGNDAKAWHASYTNGGAWVGYTPIAGALTSSPALPTTARASRVLDLVATMDEERSYDQFVATLWWKHFPKP